MPTESTINDRWYPTREQLKDPMALERTLRQVLAQHYQLQDQVKSLQAENGKLKSQVNKPAPKFPAGSGPSDSMICGLFVQPVDTSTLANGAALKFNKSQGNFSFQ